MVQDKVIHTITNLDEFTLIQVGRKFIDLLNLEEEQMSVINQFKQYSDNPEPSNAGTYLAIKLSSHLLVSTSHSHLIYG